jgi:hypothetical protein
MIIDIHSHVWEYPRDFNDDFRRRETWLRICDFLSPLEFGPLAEQ